MTPARLNRLVADDGRCFDVAIDHGFFGEASFLRGIEDAASAVATVIDAGPDALQLSLGQAPLLQEVRGQRKPALVLRSDIAKVYGKRLPERLFSHLVDDIVTHAVRLDAACLCVNLFDLEGAPEVHERCVHNITCVKAAADPLGMPVMVEPLVMQRGEVGDGSTRRPPRAGSTSPTWPCPSLHEQVYVDVLRTGKHLMGEKPFGCVRPEEAAESHRIFTAALASHAAEAA